ncbi:MAG: DUF1501 domain-containing protein [Phycisphaerae bacterium]|nr:DUF1501 domain-containing protein [Tepidisphaeraceae bacterium]
MNNKTSIPGLPHHATPTSRRDFLAKSGAGFGALAASYLLADSATARGDANEIAGMKGTQPGSALNPLAARQGHYPATAKSVIFIFLEGGPSHIDLFDPKPLLNELSGKPLPDSFGTLITAMGESRSPLLASKRQWTQAGKSGLWMSDWIPHHHTIADDIAVIRSCVQDGINHSGGVCQMNTGSILAGRPSLGAWTTYGLGTENQNMPAFCVLTDTTSQVVNGPRNWGGGFLPAVYQGTKLQGGASAIANLNTPASVGEARQKAKLDLLASLNKQHLAGRPEQTELDARIKSYELAFRMQAEAPEVIDLAKETEATKALYGMDNKQTETVGRMCLQARRMVESGVRFVQIYHGAGSKWDAHSNIEKNHTELCAQMDKPVAGLIKDLKSRGLLDSTLVVWGGEFGRTPMSEKGNGRDHNPTGFTMWFAGGGVKGGQTIGSTDELGLRAVDQRMHVHDLHATILHLMGVNHEKLVYFHKGRPERATMNEGEIYRRITTG